MPGMRTCDHRARAHVLLFFYLAADGGLPALTNKGHEGAGLGSASSCRSEPPT